jgi:hypothetical protein
MACCRVNFTFTFYGETVIIYDEPGPENLASLVPCFETEGSGADLQPSLFCLLKLSVDGVRS